MKKPDNQPRSWQTSRQILVRQALGAVPAEFNAERRRDELLPTHPH